MSGGCGGILGTPTFRHYGYTGGVFDVQALNDHVVAAAVGGWLRVYDVRDGSVLAESRVVSGRHLHGVRLVGRVPEGGWRLVVFGENRLKVLDVAPPELRLVCDLRDVTDWVLDACPFRDAEGRDVVAAGLAQNAVEVWDHVAAPAVRLCRIECAERSLLYSMAIRCHRRGELIVASGTIMGSILLWDTSNGAGTASVRQRLCGHLGSIFGLCWDPDDAGSLCSVSDDRTVRLWSTAPVPLAAPAVFAANSVPPPAPPTTGGLRRASGPLDLAFHERWAGVGHDARVWRCELRRNYVLTGGEDATCRVWSRADGSLLATLCGHAGKNVWCVAAGPGDRWAATGGADGLVKMWDLQWEVNSCGDLWGSQGLLVTMGPGSGVTPRRHRPSEPPRLVKLLRGGGSVLCVWKTGDVWRWDAPPVASSCGASHDAGTWTPLMAASVATAQDGGDTGAGGADHGQGDGTREEAGPTAADGGTAADGATVADGAAAADGPADGSLCVEGPPLLDTVTCSAPPPPPTRRRPRQAFPSCLAVCPEDVWAAVGDTEGGCTLLHLVGPAPGCTGSSRQVHWKLHWKPHRCRVTHASFVSVAPQASLASFESHVLTTNGYDGTVRIWAIDPPADGSVGGRTGGSAESAEAPLRVVLLARLCVTAKGGVTAVMIDTRHDLLFCGDARGNLHMFSWNASGALQDALARCCTGTGSSTSMAGQHGDDDGVGMPSPMLLHVARSVHGRHPVSLLTFPPRCYGCLVSAGGDGMVLEHHITLPAPDAEARLAASPHGSRAGSRDKSAAHPPSMGAVTGTATRGDTGVEQDPLTSHGSTRVVVSHRVGAVSHVEQLWWGGRGGAGGRQPGTQAPVLVVAGFHGEFFVALDVTRQHQILRIPCGGRKRPHDFFMADGGGAAAPFVLVSTGNAEAAGKGRRADDTTPVLLLQLLRRHSSSSMPAVTEAADDGGEHKDGKRYLGYAASTAAGASGGHARATRGLPPAPRLLSPCPTTRTEERCPMIVRALGEAAGHGRVITDACWIQQRLGMDSDRHGQAGESYWMRHLLLVTCGEDTAVKLWSVDRARACSRDRIRSDGGGDGGDNGDHAKSSDRGGGACADDTRWSRVTAACEPMCLQTDRGAHPSGVRCLAVCYPPTRSMAGHSGRGGMSNRSNRRALLFSGGGKHTICCWALATGMDDSTPCLHKIASYTRPSAQQDQRVLGLTAFTIAVHPPQDGGVEAREHAGPSGQRGEPAGVPELTAVAAGDSEGVCRVILVREGRDGTPLLAAPRSKRGRPAGVGNNSLVEVATGGLGGSPVRSVCHLASGDRRTAALLGDVALVFAAGTNGRVRVWDVRSVLRNALSLLRSCPGAEQHGETRGRLGASPPVVVPVVALDPPRDERAAGRGCKDSGEAVPTAGGEATPPGPSTARRTMSFAVRACEVHQVHAHQCGVNSICASADRRHPGYFKAVSVGDDQGLTVSFGSFVAGHLRWLGATKVAEACGSALQGVRYLPDAGLIFTSGWNQRLTVWEEGNRDRDRQLARATDKPLLALTGEEGEHEHEYEYEHPCPPPVAPPVADWLRQAPRSVAACPTDVADATSIDVACRDDDREVFDVIVAGAGLHVVEVSFRAATG